jgi:hypothetical protein
MADSVKKQKVDVKGKVVNLRIDMDDQPKQRATEQVPPGDPTS